MNPAVDRLEALLDRIQSRRREPRGAASRVAPAEIAPAAPAVVAPVAPAAAAVRPEPAASMARAEGSEPEILVQPASSVDARDVEAAVRGEAIAAVAPAVPSRPIATAVSHRPASRPATLGALFARALALRPRP